MQGMDSEFKKRFDTTKISPEELKMCNVEDARRPLGKGPSPGGKLHQHGGVSLSKAGLYPMALAGVAAVVGIGTFMYYRSLDVQEIPRETNRALDTINIPRMPPATKAPADSPRC